MATPYNGPKSNFAAFSGKGHEAIFEFHASPLRGVHHGGVSLWPCSSRRQVTRHGRQPGGANASVGGSAISLPKAVAQGLTQPVIGGIGTGEVLSVRWPTARLFRAHSSRRGA